MLVPDQLAQLGVGMVWCGISEPAMSEIWSGWLRMERIWYTYAATVRCLSTWDAFIVVAVVVVVVTLSVGSNMGIFSLVSGFPD